MAAATSELIPPKRIPVNGRPIRLRWPWPPVIRERAAWIMQSGQPVPDRTFHDQRVVRCRVLVSGRVQGVFFRDTCRRTAERHGVNGWVRNLPDGRVEAVFEGPAEEVRRLVEWSRHGPRSAVVENVHVQAEQPEGVTGFRIL